MTKTIFFACHLLKHIFGLMLLLTLTNCTNKQQNPHILRVGLANEIKNFDLRESRDKNIWPLSKLLTQSLLRTQPDGTLQPSLALKWEIRAPSTLVFHLDPTSVFHNGAAVTAEDVVYSYQDASRPKSPIASLLEGVLEYKTPNSHVLEMRLKDSELLPFLGNVVPIVRILPKSYASQKGLFSKHPIGSGPYRFAGSKNRVITLERHDTFRPLPTFRTIKFYGIANPNTRLLSIAAGDIDLLINNFPLTQINKVIAPYALSLESRPGTRLTYLGFNLKNLKLKDNLLRRALFKALNREVLIEKKLSGMGQIARSVLPPSSLFHKETMTSISSELLDSKLPKTPLSLRLLGTNSPEDKGLLLAIQSEWKKVGVETQIHTRDFAGLMTAYELGDFDVILTSFAAKADPDFLYSFFHSSQLPPGRNRFHYQNSEIDQLLTLARRATEHEKRQKLYAKVQEILMDDLPLLPLWYSKSTVLVRKHKSEILRPENKFVLEELY